jgi:hypothetical protein
MSGLLSSPVFSNFCSKPVTKCMCLVSNSKIFCLHPETRCFSCNRTLVRIFLIKKIIYLNVRSVTFLLYVHAAVRTDDTVGQENIANF